MVMLFVVKKEDFQYMFDFDRMICEFECWVMIMLFNLMCWCMEQEGKFFK